MALVAVFADPPREGLALPELAAASPLSAGEAAELYAAMLADAVAAVEDSGGDLLVNYRPDDLIDAGGRDGGTDGDAEADVRAAVEGALSEPAEARFEPQVGSSRAARVGNTVTYLLEREGENAVIVLDPAAPTIGRTAVDETAMKLRRSEVVLGPAAGGRVAMAAFAESIDFEGALAPPAVETLTARAGDAGLETDFRALEPLVETGSDLLTLVSLVRARADAGRIVPPATAETIDDLGLVVVEGPDGVELRRGTDRS